MSIEPMSLVSGRTVRMSGKTFSKLLSLAELENWRPSQLPQNWSDPTADTEFILQEIDEDTRGLVSRIDAADFTEALAKAMKDGGAALEPELYLAALDVTSTLGRTGFTVTELSTGDTVVFRR